MSFFNKGFQALGGASAPSFFNKVAGGARSLFNKAPQALRSFSSGLGQASRALGSAANTSNRLLSDPQISGLAKQIGAGGALGTARGVAGNVGQASSLLNRVSKESNPDMAGSVASSAIEKARSVARGAGINFL